MIARARALPSVAARRMVQALDLGDGYGFLGFAIEPRVQDDAELVAVVMAVGQKMSELQANPTVKVPIGIIGGITIADFKKRIDGEEPTADGDHAPEPD